MQPFSPRSVHWLGLLLHRGWHLKRYGVVFADAGLDEQRFVDGRALALNALPDPPVNEERLGVGFLIEHQGNGADYVVLCWWDRENELPIRVFVSHRGSHWRAATESESICVWDLEILWLERQAYVATVLNHSGVDVDAYVATRVLGA